MELVGTVRRLSTERGVSLWVLVDGPAGYVCVQSSDPDVAWMPSREAWERCSVAIGAVPGSLAEYGPSGRADLADVRGTSWQGEIAATYRELVDAFGPPGGPSADGKITARWVVDTPLGVATVYAGVSGSLLSCLGLWDVGGHKRGVVAHVRRLLEVTGRG